MTDDGRDKMVRFINEVTLDNDRYYINKLNSLGRDLTAVDFNLECAIVDLAEKVKELSAEVAWLKDKLERPRCYLCHEPIEPGHGSVFSGDDAVCSDCL